MTRTRRSLMPSPFAYKYAPGMMALDAAPVDAVERDESRMSASCRLASTRRDHEGDVMEVDGVSLSVHRTNPVAMLDHGEDYPLSIGYCRSPEGIYLVDRRGDNELWETTFFNQDDPTAVQVYGLIVRGVLRGNSIGFREVESAPLPPDPEQGFYKKRGRNGEMLPAGKWIKRSLCLEATWTCLPMNPDCVREVWDAGKIDGKRFAPAVKAMLSRHRPARRAFLFTGAGKTQARDELGRFGFGGGEPEKGDEISASYVEAFNDPEAESPATAEDANIANEEMGNDGSDYRIVPRPDGKWEAVTAESLESEYGEDWTVGTNPLTGEIEAASSEEYFDDLASIRGDDLSAPYVAAFNDSPSTQEDADQANEELRNDGSDYRIAHNAASDRWEAVPASEVDEEDEDDEE